MSDIVSDIETKLLNDVQAIREFAADFVADLCRRLLTGGAPSLHFYTLNLSKPTLNVLAKMA